jgi:hypothetical protein
VSGERNGETQFPALQSGEQATGAVLNEADLNPGMSALVADEEGGQETLQRERRRADANNARVPASQGAGALAE